MVNNSIYILISFLCQADVVNENKRAAVFGWITGLFSASHVVGNVLARFLPQSYIFVVILVHRVLCWCSYIMSRLFLNFFFGYES